MPTTSTGPSSHHGPGPSDTSQGKKRKKTGSGAESPRSRSQEPPPRKKADPGFMADNPPKSKKKKSRPHALGRKDVTAEERPTKEALEVILCAVMGILKGTDAPRPPSAAELQRFKNRYNSIAAVREKLKSAPFSAGVEFDAIIETTREKAAAAAKNRSAISRRILQIPPHVLSMFFGLVYSLGFQGFHPKVSGHHTDLYNVALENVAIRAFREAVASGGFDQFDPPPNIAIASNPIRMSEFYRNFMYSNLAQKAKDQAAGKNLQEEAALRNARRRRNEACLLLFETSNADQRFQLCNDRGSQARRSGYPPRVIDNLIDHKLTHSDDEAGIDPTSGFPAYIIADKRGRSRKVTNLYRQLDTAQAAETAAFDKAIPSNKRHRVDVERPPVTRISKRHPLSIALDYFSPVFFNDLPVSSRALFLEAPIAMPLENRLNENNRAWMAMGNDEFMEEYGNEVRELYEFPTEAELDNIEWYMADDEEEDDFMDEDEA